MIVVRQPPWLSAWAMAGYATLAVIGLLLVWGSYRRGEKRRRAMREALQKRALAEQQRKIMARLNRNLEPQALGRVVAAEFCEVAGGKSAWLSTWQKAWAVKSLPAGQACRHLKRFNGHSALRL